LVGAPLDRGGRDGHARSVSPRARRVVLASLVIGSLLGTRLCSGELPVTFHSPHVTRAAAATFAEDYARQVDTQIKVAKSDSVAELVSFSLSVTASDLHFGLEHKTTLAFGKAEREGNCVEYAHLFATVFNRAAERKQVAARAYVVRSDARVLGVALPGPKLRDHDWVLVVPTRGHAQRLFIDPTLHDLGLDWDISRNVSGEVRAP
jgi:hypothetical protein